MRISLLRVLLISLILLAGPAAFTSPAQEQGPDIPTPPSPVERERWTPIEGGPEIRVDSIYVTPAQVEGSQGKYSLARLRAAVTYTHFTLGYTRRLFSWSGTGSLPFGNGRDDPWNILHTVEFKAKYSGPIHGQWRYYFSGELSSSFEENFGTPGFDMLAAIGYDFSPQLKFRAGAAMLLHEVRIIAVPVAAFKWWGGGDDSGRPRFSASVGLPESTLTYHSTPAWSFTASVLADSKVYNLADESPVINKGYVETRDLIVGLLINYSPSPQITVSSGLGYDFYRQLDFYDQQGHKQGTYSVNGAWAGRLMLGVKF